MCGANLIIRQRRGRGGVDEFDQIIVRVGALETEIVRRVARVLVEVRIADPREPGSTRTADTDGRIASSRRNACDRRRGAAASSGRDARKNLEGHTRAGSSSGDLKR